MSARVEPELSARERAYWLDSYIDRLPHAASDDVEFTVSQGEREIALRERPPAGGGGNDGDDGGDVGDPYSLGWVQELMELRWMEREGLAADPPWEHIVDEFYGGGPHKFVESPAVYEKGIFETAGREIWINLPKFPKDTDKIVDGVTFKDHVIGPLPGTDPDSDGGQPGSGPKWNRRLYGIRKLEVRRQWVHDLGNTTDNHPEYISGLEGDCLFSYCLYESCGGNFQVRDDRAKPRAKGEPKHGVGWNPAMGPGHLRIEYCGWLDCGFGTRGSFPLGVFIGWPDAKFDVTIDHVFIDNSWVSDLAVGKEGYLSRGGIIVQGSNAAHNYGTVQVRDSIVHTEKSDRFCYFNCADSVLMFASEFVSSGKKNIVVDRRDYSEFADCQPTGRFVVEGCSGNAGIFIAKEQVGEISEDIVIEHGKVVRRGVMM